MNTIHICPCCYPKTYFNIFLPSTPRTSEWSLPFTLSNRNNAYISHLSHACYMSRPFRPPWFDHPVKSLACLLSLPYEKSLHSHPSGHSLTCSSVPFKLSTMTWRRTGEWRYISTHFLTSISVIRRQKILSYYLSQYSRGLRRKWQWRCVCYLYRKFSETTSRCTPCKLTLWFLRRKLWRTGVVQDNAPNLIDRSCITTLSRNMNDASCNMLHTYHVRRIAWPISDTPCTLRHTVPAMCSQVQICWRGWWNQCNLNWKQAWNCTQSLFFIAVVP